MNPPVERRLSTILAADVVGYSRLVQQNEAGAIWAFRETLDQLIRPKANQYRGRIVKLMGDGLLMEFVSVVDAVGFAVELQNLNAERQIGIDPSEKMLFRIGINIGDIIVDGDDILGDGVNIAARLEGLADVGGVFISGSAHQQVTGKIDLNFAFAGDRALKNVADPVPVHRVEMDAKAAAIATEIVTLQPVRKKTRLTLIASVAVFLIAIAAVYFRYVILQPPLEPGKAIVTNSPAPSKPSLAVLPFENASSDPKDGAFSAGLTMDLAADLSRFSDLIISSNNSVFNAHSETSNVSELAKRLNVRYLLDGTAQRAGDQIRVNITLIESVSGKLLWTARFNRRFTDVFKVQDEIVQAIIANLTLKVSEIELRRSQSRRPSELKAYDYVLRGRSASLESSRKANLESRRLFQVAVEIDPDFAAAYTGLGRSFLSAAANGWSANPRADLKRAHDLAETALAFEDHAEAHALLGLTYMLMRHFDLAETALDRAIALNPNDADSYGALGAVELWTSNLEDALVAFRASMRLDPRSSPLTLTGIGVALFLAGDSEAALQYLERSITREPDDILTLVALASIQTDLGNREAAQEAVAKVKNLHPFFSPESYRNAFSNTAHGEKLVSGMVQHDPG